MPCGYFDTQAVRNTMVGERRKGASLNLTQRGAEVQRFTATAAKAGWAGDSKVHCDREIQMSRHTARSNEEAPTSPGIKLSCNSSKLSSDDFKVWVIDAQRSSSHDARTFRLCKVNMAQQMTVGYWYWYLFWVNILIPIKKSNIWCRADVRVRPEALSRCSWAS